MAEIEDPKDEQDKRRRYEENVPSPRILKLAILAAAIIVIIAIVIYLKARNAPPALHDQLREKPGQSYAVNNLLTGMALTGNFQEAPWSLQQTASRIRS